METAAVQATTSEMEKAGIGAVVARRPGLGTPPEAIAIQEAKAAKALEAKALEPAPVVEPKVAEVKKPVEAKKPEVKKPEVKVAEKGAADILGLLDDDEPLIVNKSEEVLVDEAPTTLLDIMIDPDATVLPTAEPEWLWADGMRGEGEKPDWLKSRYNSVADQAEAYTELEKKFGEFKGAPKDGYNFDDIDSIDPDNPLISHFSKTFKDMNLSQDGFNRILSEFESLQQNMSSVDVAEEMKKLGPQGQEMIKQTSQWVANNLPKDIAATVHTWIQTADDFRALDTIRSFQPLSATPSYYDMNPNQKYESSTEIRNEKTKNWTRYQEDVNYRNGLVQRLNAAVRREGARKGKQVALMLKTIYNK